MFDRIVEFTFKTIKVTQEKLVNFAKGVFKHAESITILTAASIGINTLMGELPFYYTAPMWLEAQLVVPVLSVIFISLLVKSAETRQLSRARKQELRTSEAY